jgi:uncharacterized protein YdbL (DUF1318 family)
MTRRLFLLLAAAGLLAGTVLAQNAADLQRRMRDRLPQLDALKEKGVIGENNRGFVEVRGGGDASASGLVSDENRDREVVYELIARQTGSTAENVGRARARDIAGRSRPGVWVQDESGRWARK